MGRFCGRDFKPLGRLLPWVVGGLLGCSGDDNHIGLTGPGGGALEVITATTGVPEDPDGYSLTVDDDAARSLAPNTADTVAPLSPGPHTVELAGIAVHCGLVGENPRTVDIAAGDTVSVRFAITCGTSGLRISVATTGSELDSDGYEVFVDDVGVGWLTPDGDILVPFLSSGPHTVALSGVAPNCAVSGEHPRTVSIVDGSGAVHLDVVCHTAITLAVHVATSGDDPDPDGYVASRNGGSRVGVHGGLGTFAGGWFVEPGAYTVVLSDVAPHCTLSSPNTATATVVSGGTATVNFTVTCGPLVAVPPGRDILLDPNLEIYLLSADGSRFVRLTDHPDDDGGGRWSPDGQTIAFTSGHYVPIRPGDQFSPSRFLSHIFVMNADGSGRTQLTTSETPDLPLNFRAGEQGPAWSPDGKRIAYLGTTPDSSASIFVMNADGSGQTQLTTGGAVRSGPAWSPDGTRIAYSDWSSEHLGIFLISADGSGVTRLTDAIDAGAAWSPDGTRIAFVRTVVGQGDAIYVVNANGSGLTQLTSDPGDSRRQVSWSPDGTKIAFELGGKIYVVNGNGTGLTQLTFGPRADSPVWSPDGGKIAYYVHQLTHQPFLMNPDGSGEAPLAPPSELGVPSSAAWRP